MMSRNAGALALILAVPALLAGNLVPGSASKATGLPVGEMASHSPEVFSEDPFVDRPLEPVRDVPVAPPGVTPPPGLRDRPYSRRVRASFRLRVRDLFIPYRILAITARPGEVIQIELDEVWGESTPEDFRLRTPDGIHSPVSAGRWSWSAPLEPGAVPLRVEATGDADAIALNVFVLHPVEAAADGSLNGFRIGDYRVPAHDSPPPGFIEAVDEVLDLRVAPGFTLGQFLPHQPGDPRYLALSESLLLKLEAVLEEVKAEGIRAETLHVMSAFRTPHYNRAIGNTTDGSRHLWGDAADVFIDEAGDGWMDSLNDSGRGTDADARELYRIIERVEARGERHVRPGGLSLYRSNARRGPFIHVDARGTPARW